MTPTSLLMARPEKGHPACDPPPRKCRIDLESEHPFRNRGDEHLAFNSSPFAAHHSFSPPQRPWHISTEPSKAAVCLRPRVQGKPTSYRRLLDVLSDIVSEENKKDRNHSLNEDRYRPRSSGIAVHDAGVYPCGGANCHRASQNINHGAKPFGLRRRPEKDKRDSDHHW